ncbi:MAG: histidine kinase [Vicinamibacterales bacterium]
MHPILADRRRFQLHLIAWTLVGGILALLVHSLLAIPWGAALVFGLPLGLVAAPVSLSAWYVCRATPLSRVGPLRAGATAVATAVLTAAVWAGVGRGWWILLRGQGVSLPASAEGSLFTLLLGLGALAYLLSVTVHYLFQAFEESAAAARRTLEAEVAHREAELRALRAQVDPHFLFNSLNSVSGLIGAAPDRARLMCRMLADFLRDSLTLGTVPRIPLAREVALSEQYLRIEQVRFGERLGVEATVDPACVEVPVPPLILQPLVENAVRHGIATRLDGGVVRIEARLAGDRAVCVVTNPRDPDTARRGTGFGLDIVRRRLRGSFGEAAALAVEPSDEAYRATITMPVEAAADRRAAGEGPAATGRPDDHEAGQAGRGGDV